MPTGAELQAALDRLQAAIEAMVGIRWRVWRIARTVRDERGEFETDPRDAVPTWEDIGRLYVFAVEADTKVRELRDCVDELTRDEDGVMAGLLYDSHVVLLGEKGDDA
jgi:hypothetical protein